MVTKEDLEKWQLHQEKQKLLYEYGVKNGLMDIYDNELIETLRHIYYGGLPISILLLHYKLSNGYCYNRSRLITLGFLDDDFQVVVADIDSLRLKPEYLDKYREGQLEDDYATHSFVERKTKDGKIQVYDTSLGIVFEKDLYYKIENPKIKVIYDKKTTLDYLSHDFQENYDVDNNKYALPLILPNIEKCLIPTQSFYLDQLKEEIKLLKEEFNYDDMCMELHEDMREKFVNRLTKKR